MADMNEEERAVVCRKLLTYCGLDIYAMVKVWEKLANTIAHRSAVYISDKGEFLDPSCYELISKFDNPKETSELMHSLRGQRAVSR